MENKIALITGATSGIGEATAYKLAEMGYDLIITGRRVKSLMLIEQKIHSEFKVRCLSLSFDIRNLSDVEAAVKKIPEDWKKIDVLINNAGLALGLEPLFEGDFAKWEQMIDTNVKGLLFMTRLLVPEMIKRGKGHVVNLSSIAGKEAYANGGVYCATKHAVEAITKSLRIDLLPHGIKVSSVSPGMVNTEFSKVRFEGDEEKADAVYTGLDPLLAKDIADAIAWIISRPKHVNINDILIMPTAQADSTYTYKKTEA